jgi:hypothetical protein
MQVVAVLEVPVEAALGQLQLAGQHFHLDLADAQREQHIECLAQPGVTIERFLL